MKSLIIVLLVLISGCAQLLNGQQQPVIAVDLNKNIYMTNCGGAAEYWGSCNEKALKTCANGYDVLSKAENSTGTKREIKFQCRK